MVAMAKIKFRISYLEHTTDGLVSIENIGSRIDEERGFSLIPSVGDYVNIEQNLTGDGQPFHGVIRSKNFTYRRTENMEVFCFVEIIVERTDALVSLYFNDPH